MLEIGRLTVRFGGVTALDAVGLVAGQGELVGLIGPNGAGKSTLFDCVTRRRDPDDGVVRVGGQDVLTLAPHLVAGCGIARTFQQPTVFPRLSVRENVMTGAHRFGAAGFWRAAFAWDWERRLRERADDVLDMFGLLDVGDHPAAGLPFGVLKRVEIARAVAAEPRLLLLDEPAGGLSPEEALSLMALVRALHRTTGMTVIVVEHHMEFVLGLCERIVCLDLGHKIADGPTYVVRRDPAVIAACLGAR
ncbi:ABC transporter ATP-binding protein [Herbidospora mongoliensis]|uniref:ABC transporter ATP-binding protein n=1 Tax=Herbidospora mongoliensis TaxID=688067 RepID=UPI000830E45A|nr:ABC transporter ATP-binding protein [Herbidospora mongoliensis]